ncbi:MAG: hypothetical protein FDZ70_09650 [Actinobacteria bacterium]|nr:MAG: hypothetical protein FDZ70_09650 [Actinomycetota bacterium]
MVSILSTITVTLKDDEAESAFVAAFTSALGATEGFPGLEKLVAAKVLGAERTYHLHTVWASADAMAAWQEDVRYRAVRDAFDVSIVSAMDASRWVPAP